ncbi:hypothetical protein FQA39_LY02757 [Lamprigera yunnana]|nr:hypothetical protein FQA39_LY02757 [Lamprigera yunnana]
MFRWIFIVTIIFGRSVLYNENYTNATVNNNTSTSIPKPENYSNSSFNIQIATGVNLDPKSYRFSFNVFGNFSTLGDNCRKATTKFLIALNRHEIWAMKMYDATAKWPSGILNGNVNQYGDYDECLSVNRAKYCLAEISAKSMMEEPYNSIKHLIHSHYPFKGTFNDPQHRVPDFSSIKWGVCLPSECTPKELETYLASNLNVRVRVRQSLCKDLNTPTTSTFGDYFARFFFVTLLLAIIISSVLTRCIEIQADRENIALRVLLCFAVQNSWKQLCNTSDNYDHIRDEVANNNNAHEPSSEIKSIHGIRVFSAVALLMCHKSIALMYNPYINRTSTMETFGQAWTVIGRTAIVYTDSFMLISGLLTKNGILRDIKIYGSLRFLEKLRNRIFRILPNIIVLILFCSYILPNLNSGPLWPMVIEHHATLCKKYMWRNFLFVHNYFGFENMCLTHTHQVGIDMQLFVFTYLISVLISSKKSIFFVMSTLWILSLILRYVVTIRKNLSHMIYFGIPIHRMFDTANFSYILPTHRATIYITGIFLAHVLKNKIQVKKRQVTMGWIVSGCCGALAIVGPFHMAQSGYVYNNRNAAIFGALSPILWGIFLSWIIVTSNNECAGWFGNILSSKCLKYFTKISYSFYLVQFPVFFYNVGVQRTSSRYSPLELLHYSETTVIIILSVVLTLCVEIPFQTVGRVLFNKSRLKTNTRIKIC